MPIVLLQYSRDACTSLAGLQQLHEASERPPVIESITTAPALLVHAVVLTDSVRWAPAISTSALSEMPRNHTALVGVRLLANKGQQTLSQAKETTGN